MSIQQLPIINNSELFENLACDLFNELNLTITFKHFGKSGHKQKGIDLFSVEKDIAIQCKKKDLSRKDLVLRRELVEDIEKDINLIISKDLKIKIDTLYILSTYNNHPDLDEICEDLKKKLNLDFDIIYWGWQTIENRVLNYPNLLKKYWPNFIINTNSKEREFKRNLDLRKQIKIDFSDGINYSFGNRKRNSKMIIRAFDGTQYPSSNLPDENGNYSWFSVEIKGLYHKGMEFILSVETIDVFDNNKWKYNANQSDIGYETIKVFKVGQINFTDIVDYDIQGDEHYNSAFIFCKFQNNGTQFESYYYQNSKKPYEIFDMTDMIK